MSENINKNKLPFRVAMGEEEKIKAIKDNNEIENGKIYFSTNTKKIFLAKDNQLLSMGGNSGIFYGKQPIPEIPDFSELTFERQYIEGENTPNVDDLILNNDGCFYRVTGIFEENGQEVFKTIKQTLQGTGGGGSAGGGPSIPVGEGSITLLKPTTSTSILYGEDFTVQFNIRAIDADGIETLDPITYSVYLNNSCIIKNAPGKQGFNETENLKKYLSLGDKNVIVIYAYAYIGGTEPVSLKTKAINIATVTMNLIWDYDEKQLNYIEDDFNLKWTLTGANGIEKNTHIIINDLYNIDLTNSEENKNSTSERNYCLKWSDYGLNYHAVHKIEIYGDIVLNGITIPTPHIIKNILLIDETNDTPLISCNLPSKEVMQYNTIQIPIMIYSSANAMDNFIINLNEDGKLKDSWLNVKNLEWNNWNYTPTKSGDVNINIQCGEAEVSFLLKVIPLDINNEEVSDYAFKFAASQFASNNAVQSWENNGITATFNDEFDWINGGLKSEKDKNGFNRQYVYIPAGSRMIINYELFKKAANTYGKTFKIIFKATKCRNYDAQVLKCWSNNSETGLVLQAQTATFKTGSIDIEVPYCEDKYLEFEIDITKKDSGKRYITTWLDGVPCGIRTYTEDDQFTQSNPKYIEIGSNECDVCLYLFKVYEKHLTDNQHLENFIADAPNAEEMLARFKRNDILDERGEISYLKLAEANPNCKVHIYDIKEMTVNKDDKISECNYSQYQGSSSAVISSNDCTIRVQGTSSAAYGLAAFNLDTDFTVKEEINGEEVKVSTLYDANGNHLADGWSMTEDAIPCTYFTTKVNVASCEGANNAINQEWYNKFQPYKSPAKEKNSKARDTMQFTPGVIFIKDNNKVTEDPNNIGVNENVFKDTPGYIDAPFYKMYSVCNMGNSKKNVHVFHDLTNPLECCIENGDNQLPGQWMIIPQGGHYDENNVFVVENIENIDTEENYNKWLNGMDEIYGFRYPDAKPTELLEKDPDNADKMIRGWFNFVNWMSMNDPNPRYKKIDILNEEDFSKNEKLFIIDENEKHILATGYTEGIDYFIETPHLRGYTNEPLTESVTFGNYTFEDTKYTKTLAGLTIPTYAGKYTHDTYEYRMAKMLNECKDHLVMDSIVFHYLFIERHTMIDNVAKNTFWSTEDCIHWDLTKDYDNDTSDGNDNQGKLSLTYGYEPLDKKDGISVFNASDSVWLTFIQGLSLARQKVYQVLDTQGAWSAKDYLKDFNDWQNAIPERCWIEDYYRKYVRPLEVYNDSMYLDMLEGGKKTHQREQYETYQNYYISSEYVGKDSSAAKIIMRPNATGLSDDKIPVKMYADCYIQASIGNGADVPNAKKRVKRGEEEYIEIPKGFDDVVDATMYLFSPYLFSELGNEEYTLQNLLLKQFSTASAKKLTKINLGVYEDDLDPITVLEQDFDFSGSDLLEELHIANYHLDGRTLDLTENKSLKFLDARNSYFTAIALADGCAVEQVYLENPTILSLSNLTEVKNFNINDYSRLNSLNLINIDKSPNLNSYDLVIKTLEKDKNNSNPNDNIFKTYYLKDVDWKVNNFSEITNHGSYLSIYTLEELQKRRSSKEGYGHDMSLTGSLTVRSEVFAGDANIALNTYRYYRKVYPSLDINFENENSKLYTVNILDGNNKVCWTSKLKAGDSVNAEFLGPENEEDNVGGGLNNGTIKAYNISFTDKEPSAAESYTFANSWKVYDAITKEELNYQVNATEENGYMPWIDNVSRDINIVPQYNSEPRKYTITFYNISSEYPLIEVLVPYGTILETIIPEIVPYKDDPNLLLEEVYHFDGFSATVDGNILQNLNNFEIKTTLNLYAQFSCVNVHSNILDNKYLKYENYKEGYAISIKDEYRNSIKGKITLPITYNNEPILQIKDFSECNMTHVFFDNNSNQECQIKIIGKEGTVGTDEHTGFRICQKLKYFEIMPSIKVIGERAFSSRWSSTILDSKLFNMTNNNLNKFFENIEEIKSYAFMGCKYIEGTVRFSGSLRYIGEWGFYGSNIKEIIFGENEDWSQFYKNQDDWDEVKIYPVFDNNNSLNKIYFYVEKDSDMTEARKVAILEDFTKNSSITFGYGKDEEV